MSGVTKAVGKIFKSVRNVARKVWDNKLLRAAIIIGAVAYGGYLLANPATAAPVSGQGLTFASGATEGTTFTTMSSSLDAGITASELGVGSTAVAPTAAQGGIVTAGEFVPATADIAVAGGTGSEVAAGGADLLATGGVEAGGAGIVDSVVAGGKAVGGWMQANPIATMMLGQGVSGAMSSMEARKAEDRARAERQSYGAMGYDRSGDYKGATGVVNSQRQPAATETQKVRSVNRNQLPDLQKQGLIT